VLLWLVPSLSLIYYSPRTRIDCPTILYKKSWESVGLYSPAFDTTRNYSVYLASDPCAIIPPSAANSVVFYNIQGNYPCGENLMAYLKTLPFPIKGVVYPTIIPAFFALTGFWLSWNPAEAPPVPILTCHVMTGFEQYSQPIDLTGTGRGIVNVRADLRVNASNSFVTLTPPPPSAFWNNWLTIGSETQFYYVCNTIAALSVLIVSSVKIMAFFNYGGLHLSIPLIALACAWCAAVVSLFLAGVGFQVWRSDTSWQQVYYFFESFPIMFCCSISILMGFYFLEVALLTSGAISLRIVTILVSHIVFSSTSNWT
jgi:hypothetical protein